MSPNDKVLYAFSVCFILVMGAMLVSRVLRRKTDFFTTWTFFIVGSIIFTGLSGINATSRGHYLPSYTAADYQLFYVGTILYFLSTLCTYHFWKIPRRVAGFTLLSWPRLSGWTLVILTVGLAAIGLFQRFPLPIPFVGQLLFQFGVATPLLAFACAFIAWYRQPSNPLLLALLIGIAGLALFTTIGLGSSRRYLMATLAVVPLCMYWVWLRYKPTGVIIAWLLAGLFVGLPVLKAYTALRHNVGMGEGGGSARALALIRGLPREIMSGGSSEGFMGQDSVEAALLAIHMLNDNSDRIEVAPFHSLIYIITNPVPRSLWPEKPIGFGVILPEAAKLSDRGINANLGVNVAGQCFYDGGLLIHLLYGFITGAFFRYYDELLVRQAGNPLLIGGLVFMAPQIIALPRGGIETMGLQIFLGFIVVVLTSLSAKVVFGVGEKYPRTDHIIDYPQLRSPEDLARWMQGYTAITVTQPRRRFNQDDPEDTL